MKLPLTAYNIKYEAWLQEHKDTNIDALTKEEHKKYVQEFLATTPYGK
jgi:hypothetical protein